MIRTFRGKTPQIAASAFVDNTAVIIGDVEIGEGSSVWPGAVIRGDLGKIWIGKESIVEDNCVIHSGSPGAASGDVRIGDRVTIGHGAVLNCKSVGNYVVIGMNATVIHGAEIGNYCIVGAATLVGEGKVIPDNSLVLGVPGTIKGHPSDKQLWRITHLYEDYRKLMQAAQDG
jgi:carbonic anhydrase/acetyltransferase-like protein (isoleucine patch superfamily)